MATGCGTVFIAANIRLSNCGLQTGDTVPFGERCRNNVPKSRSPLAQR